jgi:hypothetical protein
MLSGTATIIYEPQMYLKIFDGSMGKFQTGLMFIKDCSSKLSVTNNLLLYNAIFPQSIYANKTKT